MFKMKNHMTVRLMIAATFILSGLLQASAQGFEDILSAGVEDANTYLEKYAAPGINSFGVGLTGGWYNTAKPHKIVGLDVTVSANVATIPDAEKVFDFASAGFQNLMLDQTGGTDVPTLVGGDATSGSEIYIPANTTIEDPTGGGNDIVLDNEIRFATPNGVINLDDIPVVTGMPAPTANIGIGLIKNTDLKIRYTPEISTDGFKLNMFGIGVMHDVKQWIPVIKNLPFDLSAFFGTTKLTAEYAIDVDVNNSSDNGFGGQSSTSFTGMGNAKFETSATTVQAIISKKLLFFTPYASVGFNAVKSNFTVDGDYTLSSDPDDRVSGDEQTQNVSDPIDMEFTDAGGARMTVGARVKLLILTIHADYTLQKYNTFTAGIGLSIR
jgi:hypothetical protein